MPQDVCIGARWLTRRVPDKVSLVGGDAVPWGAPREPQRPPAQERDGLAPLGLSRPTWSTVSPGELLSGKNREPRAYTGEGAGD